MRLARFARVRLTPRFTHFFTDFEKKTDCFAVYRIDQNSNSKHKKKRLKTLKEVINSTANAKKGTNGQTGSKYIFQLLFVMFDIVSSWEKFLLDTEDVILSFTNYFLAKVKFLSEKKIIGNINPWPMT